MQDHPMRERIYLALVRFGVPHTDWKYVFIITMLGFVLPFLLGFRIYGIPAPMFTGVSALALSVAFFNFIRIGRRPYWFQHSLRALLTSSRQRAALPVDELDEAWLEDADAPSSPAGASAFRFEYL
jgi:hypothetical protein